SVPPRGSGWVRRRRAQFAKVAAHAPTRYREVVLTRSKSGVILTINDRETIRRILDECRTIAVVGLSSDPFRPSNSVSAYMKRQGYRVIAVNPNETAV